jgi:DNA mismatch repair ATPase MutS
MESVVQHTSSFMADLAQVSNVLNRATPHSLVLLDEFGKGTLTADGVGLLAAVLGHYAAQPTPPLLLACTHFSELLAPGACVCGRGISGPRAQWGLDVLQI